MTNIPTLPQIAEDQAKQGSELIAIQFILTSVLRVMDPAVAARVFEESKAKFALIQNIATSSACTGYAEEALLIVEQLEAGVAGNPALLGARRFGNNAWFDATKLPRAKPMPPQSGA